LRGSWFDQSWLGMGGERSGPSQDLRDVTVHVGEFLGEGGLDGGEAEAGLGVEVKRGDAKADGDSLALPLGEAEEADELADVGGELGEVAVIVVLKGGPEADQDLPGVEVAATTDYLTRIFLLLDFPRSCRNAA